MSRKALVFIGVGFIILGAIGIVLFLLNRPQDTRSRAAPPEEDLTSSTNQTCTPPAQVQGVLVEFPSCEGEICSFIQASCSWGATTGATSYKVKITEEDTGTVVKDETIQAGTVKTVFPVTTGKTYKCDVSAVNSCGATGTSGTHSLLCQVDEPIPVSPTPVPTTPPQTPQLTCGQSGCDANNPCIAGLECVTTGTGNYCAYPVYKMSCSQSPSQVTCCTEPQPTAPPPPPVVGFFDKTLFVTGGSIALVGIGAFLLFSGL